TGGGHATVLAAARQSTDPCRRGDSLHVSQLRIDSASWRFRQREVKQALSVPVPNGSLPCSVGEALGRGPGFDSRRGGWTGGGCHAVWPSCLLAVWQPRIRCAPMHTLRSRANTLAQRMHRCATYAALRNILTCSATGGEGTWARSNSS